MELQTLTQWKLAGLQQFQPLYAKHLARGVMLPSETHWMDAQVPGSVYRDLERAGLIEDPFVGLNTLACEWVANRWWAYRTEFTCTAEELAQRLFLRFDGVDYQATVYLNGQELGALEGMYQSFRLPVNEALNGPGEPNVLVVVLQNAPPAHPQGGFCSQTRYLKARFNYKWDFCARLVSLGLYGPVRLEAVREATWEWARVRPERTDTGWTLLAEGEARAYADTPATLRLDADIEGTRVTGEWPLALRDGFTPFRFALPLPEACAPRFWHPNGMGEQPLYPARLTLATAGGVEEEHRERIGFRTLAYRHADGREDALPYNVVVNGRRVYLKGTNWVPVDSRTGCEDERLERTLRAARDANVNYLRIWGGGHIESPRFYDLCDELGLLVLQEFPMSSAGVDDVPSRDPDFLRLLAWAATQAARRIGARPCIAFFDCGNELTDERYQPRPDHEAHPVGYDDPTVALLHGIIRAEAPGVLLLPSSASGPRALLDADDPGRNHDVHGPWGYSGVTSHYALYNRSDSIIHGEFGCGGMASLAQAERVLPPEERRVRTSYESRVWAHHTGGWDSYAGRERVLFGELKALPLADYIKVSQYLQAEALRYAMEANRRRLWRNVGEMTWQFNEPWPNLQCSNVYEYDGGKKLAYYAMREAYAPVLASLRYEKLFWQPGEAFACELWLTSERPAAPYRLQWVAADARGRELCRGTYAGEAFADASVRVGELAFPVPADAGGAFSVRLVTTLGDERYEKEYLWLVPTPSAPLEPTEPERLARAAFPGRADRRPDNGDLRADPTCVLRYVDRWLARAEK